MRAIIAVFLPLAAIAAPTRLDYGRVSPSNTVEYAPAVLNLGHVVDGRAYPFPVRALHPTREQYAAQGWLLIATNAPARPGYVAEPSGAWAETNGVISPVWAWRAIPPRVRTFSKLKVVLLLQERGLWPDARAWIDEQGLTDLYLAAQVFTDDNPFFAQGLAALKERFQIGDAELEAILDAVEVKQ